MRHEAGHLLRSRGEDVCRLHRQRWSRGGGCTGLDEGIAQAREAAAGKGVEIMGRADVTRQGVRAVHVEELSISMPGCSRDREASVRSFEGTLKP
jgi:hypothetical protein